MAKELLTCRNVTAGYEDCPLCREINFTLHEGEYLCVVGPSGSGKSALAAALMRVIPPIAGEIVYENRLTAADIGCMPQTLELRGASSVLDVAISGCLAGSRRLFVGRREKTLALEKLDRLGVADLAKRRFGELSGGQRQRVLLARALCGARRLLILDEPMHGLDAVAKDELFAEIISLNRDEGIAVFIIDRDALDGTVLHLSDRQLFCGSVLEYRTSVPGQLYYMGRVI